MYTSEQQAYIAKLFEIAERNAVPMAVVDYLGKMHVNAIGKFAPVTEYTKTEYRFGVRDMRHVKLYDLRAIKLNSAAIN